MTDKKKIAPEMEANKEKLEKRRKALKNILAGSGTVITAAAMQDKWAKPVIESVVLPAHAQTSGIAGFVVSNVANAPQQNQILDTLVPSAHALPSPKDICINVNGSAASVQLIVGSDPTIYTGNFTLPFGPSLLSPTGPGHTISGTLAADGNSVSGVADAQGPTSYTAPKSGATCQLTAPATTAFPTTVPPPTTCFIGTTGQVCFPI